MPIQLHLKPAAWITLVVLLLPALSARAQPARSFALSVDGAFVVPVFGLDDRFDPLVTGSIGFGRWAGNRTFAEGRVEFYGFSQGDVRFSDGAYTNDSLVIDPDRLGMTLDIAGAAAYVRRSFELHTRVEPYLLGGAGVYHWVSHRNAYEDDTRNIQALRQAQFSGGFHAGGGVEFRVATRISLDAQIRYSMIMGELWPTLRLGLENVSTFQFASGRIGLKYNF